MQSAVEKIETVVPASGTMVTSCPTITVTDPRDPSSVKSGGTIGVGEGSTTVTTRQVPGIGWTDARGACATLNGLPYAAARLPVDPETSPDPSKIRTSVVQVLSL